MTAIAKAVVSAGFARASESYFSGAPPAAARR